MDPGHSSSAESQDHLALSVWSKCRHLCKVWSLREAYSFPEPRGKTLEPFGSPTSGKMWEVLAHKEPGIPLKNGHWTAKDQFGRLFFPLRTSIWKFESSKFGFLGAKKKEWGKGVRKEKAYHRTKHNLFLLRRIQQWIQKRLQSKEWSCAVRPWMFLNISYLDPSEHELKHVGTYKHGGRTGFSNCNGFHSCMIAGESVCFAKRPPRPNKDAKNPSKHLCRPQFRRRLTAAWPPVSRVKNWRHK